MSPNPHETKNISLNNQNWSLREITKEDFLSNNSYRNDSANKENPELKVPTFIKAKVPGNVRLDLISNKIIDDPFFGMNNERSKWVSESFWEYTCKTSPASKIFGEHTDGSGTSFDYLLKFNRTDYYAKFFINNKYAGQRIGMFRPTVFRLSELFSDPADLIKKEWGDNLDLCVRFAPPPSKRWRAVKCQMSYGWDFAPDIRTIGIWDDVELIKFRGGYIKNWFLQSNISGIDNSEHMARSVKCNLKLDVYLLTNSWVKSFKDTEVSGNNKRNAANGLKSRQLKVSIKIPEINFEITKEFSVNPGQNDVSIDFKLENVKLWYPNEAGPQKLYEMEIELSDLQSGEIMYTISNIKYGFRKIRMKYNPRSMKGAEKWTFYINDRPEFIRGTNWVPPDSFFGRISEKDYGELILLAENAHMNMFRMWGGGILEKSSFYRLCDEHGIMVWQEFPFACSNYSDHEVFLNRVEQECTHYVNFLRNNPSVVAYVGGNEWNPKFNDHLVSVLSKCASRDPTREFYKVSPCDGDLHDWAVWHELMDFDAYKVGRRDKVNHFQFFSEFGLQSVPAPKTMEKVIPKDKLWPPNQYHIYHLAEIAKLKRYGRSVCKMDSLPSFAYATQVAQAEGMKYGIEYCRINKPEMSGVLFWQFNEPWPAICWSIIDYYRNPKIAYNYIKTIYQPVLPILEKCGIEKNNAEINGANSHLKYKLYIVNDTHEDLSDCLLEVSTNIGAKEVSQPEYEPKSGIIGSKNKNNNNNNNNKNQSDDIVGSFVKCITDFSNSYAKIINMENKISIPKESSVFITDLKIPLPQKLNIKKARRYSIIRKFSIKITLRKDGKILGSNVYYPFRYSEWLNFPQVVNELGAMGSYYVNEKFWFIYELGRRFNVQNL